MSIENKRSRTRRLVHLAFGLCALIVPIIGRWPSVGIAMAGLFYNMVLAPRLDLDKGYRRDSEGHFGGLVTYPLAVLLLLLTMPLVVAVGAWGVLAVADPIASAAGTRWPRPRFPANPRKSLVGSAAGFVGGTVACYLLLGYMGAPDRWGAAAVAAGAGVVAEGLPLPLEDNLPIAFASAAALLLAGL